MIDLFFQPKIILAPTRAIYLLGDPEPGDCRPYKPRPKKKAQPKVDAKLARLRARQAKWIRDKRRNDKKFREELNRRERERYAAMTPEHKAALREKMLDYKRKTRGGKRGD